MYLDEVKVVVQVLDHHFSADDINCTYLLNARSKFDKFAIRVLGRQNINKWWIGRSIAK